MECVQRVCSGIGRALCIALSNAGAKVCALARDGTLLAELAAEKSNVTPILGDVTFSAKELEEVLRPHLPFDYLVNNAGINVLQKVGEITMEAVDQ